MGDRVRPPSAPLLALVAWMVLFAGGRHAAAVPSGAALGPSDDWFELSIGGQPCGWMHSWQREVPPAEGKPARIASGDEMMMRVARAGTPVRAWTRLERVELLHPADGDAARGVESVTFDTELGGAPTTVRWEFAGGKVLERTTTPRRTSQREVDIPAGDWISPLQAGFRLEAARAAGTTPASVVTLDFQGGMQVATLELVREGQGTVALPTGESREVTWWRAASSAMPIGQREAWDAQGQLIRTVVAMQLGEVVATRTTRERALAAGAGAAEVDILVRSMVPITGATARQLERAREARFLVNREVPASAQQEVAPQEPGQWMVTVRAAPPKLEVKASLSDEERRDCLAASLLIDKDDEKVQAAAARATASLSSPTDAQRAEAMRRLAYQVIRRKDLGSVFASASDAIASRAGDCTEHAVLLAAMLRAGGIPARVACGLVSADLFAGRRDVLGWHMWTQAWIDGRWMDLDATLPDRAFHPGHLLCATSALPGSALDPALLEVGAMVGGLTVKVVDVE